VVRAQPASGLPDHCQEVSGPVVFSRPANASIPAGLDGVGRDGTNPQISASATAAPNQMLNRMLGRDPSSGRGPIESWRHDGAPPEACEQRRDPDPHPARSPVKAGRLPRRRETAMVGQRPVVMAAAMPISAKCRNDVGGLCLFCEMHPASLPSNPWCGCCWRGGGRADPRTILANAGQHASASSRHCRVATSAAQRQIWPSAADRLGEI